MSFSFPIRIEWGYVSYDLRERLNGIQEVSGSIPLISTKSNIIRTLDRTVRGSDFLFLSRLLKLSFGIEQHQIQADIPMEKLIAAMGLHVNTAARRAFWQTRRASTSRACPPIWILSFRLRLCENGAHIRHAFAEGERDGLAVVGELVGISAFALFQQIREQEH